MLSYNRKIVCTRGKPEKEASVNMLGGMHYAKHMLHRERCTAPLSQVYVGSAASSGGYSSHALPSTSKRKVCNI